MVTVTDKAVNLLDNMRSNAINQVGGVREGEEEPALRLITRKGEIGITLDTQNAGDQVVERDGHPVLLVDKKVGKQLEGTTIDVTETPEGDRLVIGD